MGPARPDGYHPLVSLAAFADVGDRLTAEPGTGLSLAVTGPFAPALEGGGENLVLKALRAAGADGLRLTLDKQLPVAAGLGGGSADAGAALRLAGRLLGLDAGALARGAAFVGADGPLCLVSRPAWAEGVGEALTLEPRLPPLHAVLVNPGAPSPTGAVYKAYDGGPAGGADRPAPPGDWRAGTVIDWLARQRNDLQAPAVALTPVIGQALAAVEAAPGVRLARMSGSGATVFGLCDTAQAARAAADAVIGDHPGWWARACVLGDPMAEVPA